MIPTYNLRLMTLAMIINPSMYLLGSQRFPQTPASMLSGVSLRNLIEPFTAADSAFRNEVPQPVRPHVGPGLRQEAVAGAVPSGVLTGTGMVLGASSYSGDPVRRVGRGKPPGPFPLQVFSCRF
jgi:hypothetical protein